MRYLSLPEVLLLHQRIVSVSGGAASLRDLGRLQAAVAQPQATFGGAELYPTLAEKAAALCFALVQGHPFVDGNKRVGHACLEVMLMVNGFELEAEVDDAEQTILALASGELTRDALVRWVNAHTKPRTSSQ